MHIILECSVAHHGEPSPALAHRARRAQAAALSLWRDAGAGAEGYDGDQERVAALRGRAAELQKAVRPGARSVGIRAFSEPLLLWLLQPSNLEQMEH